MGKKNFYRWVGDKLVPVSVNRASLLMSTGDLPKDAGDVAASIGLIAELVGDYTRLSADTDARYRAWKAGFKVDLLKDDPKMAEWKVTALAEAQPEFLAFKTEQAEWVGDLIYLRGLFEALRSKGFMVKARTDLARGQAENDELDLNRDWEDE